MTHLLACGAHDYGSCARYAASSWSGQGVLLLGALVLLGAGLFSQKTRKPALAVLAAGAAIVAYNYFKHKTGA